MLLFRDYTGREVRLTEERLAHILGEHREMVGMESAFAETLSSPEQVVQSFSDPKVRLYYRVYSGTKVGSKYLCVVVKATEEDAFVITAYLTDRIKRGEVLWARES